MNRAMHTFNAEKIYAINKSRGLNIAWKLWLFCTCLCHSCKNHSMLKDTVPIYLSRVLKSIVILCKYWFSWQKTKKANGLFIRCIYISSTKPNWLPITCRTFFAFFHRTPIRAPFSYRLSHSLGLFSRFLFSNLTNRQLAGHIWPVISKMSNKIMHRAPRAFESPDLTKSKLRAGLCARPRFAPLSSYRLFFPYHDGTTQRWPCPFIHSLLIDFAWLKRKDVTNVITRWLESIPRLGFSTFIKNQLMDTSQEISNFSSPTLLAQSTDRGSNYREENIVIASFCPLAWDALVVDQRETERRRVILYEKHVSTLYL